MFASSQIKPKVMVRRHKVIFTPPDTLTSLPFVMSKLPLTVDATGLQLFPEYYAHDIPPGTQAKWRWYSFTSYKVYHFSETLQPCSFDSTTALHCKEL